MLSKLIIASLGIGAAILLAPTATAEPAARVRGTHASRPSGEITANAQKDDLPPVPGARVQRQQARKRAQDQALGSASHDDRKRD